MDKEIRIMLSGGGTMGSVSPLLAIRDKMLEQNLNAKFIWVGTATGPEKMIIEKEGIEYHSIKSGKFRRYFSFQNFIDPLNALIGVFQSMKLIRKFKPDVILSAGGFVSVPLIIAGKLKRKKTFVHQQDIVPGLANKLMARYAKVITVSFKKSLDDFKGKNAKLTGNPVRQRIFQGNKDSALKTFQLESDLPTLVIMGGSLGAEKINQLVIDSVAKLIDFCQIIHLAGHGNIIEWVDKAQFGDKASRYHVYEYIHEELPDLYAVADLIVCRAGLSTLTEIAALRKPSMLIPIPNNQQEVNSEYFSKQNAVISLKQDDLEAEEFVRLIKGMFDSNSSLENLSRNIADVMNSDASEKYIELILEEIK